MKVVLDECLPKKLKGELVGHSVRTVPQCRWSGIKNGQLLRLMEGRFYVFITIDGNLESQQNLKKSPLGFIVLEADDNDIDTLLLLVPKILEALHRIQPGEVIRVKS